MVNAPDLGSGFLGVRVPSRAPTKGNIMARYVEITLKFENGKGLTHFCDRQEAVIKAIEMSDAGEKGAELFKAASHLLWDAIEKNEGFTLQVPGLSVTFEEEYD